MIVGIDIGVAGAIAILDFEGPLHSCRVARIEPWRVILFLYSGFPIRSYLERHVASLTAIAFAPAVWITV